ncbi:hypothetical protein DVR12_24575 [Chitinophaga silvatica]|uniref:Zinc-finger domain-containing protein n=1 Tax=Chitinophaga silvatica TaxID=2282649 RepID=A0A3E1Y3D3_9BACT|nr:hypothetical protein [Chitinophaga silvatica]RFS19152.1 hypothetical protein DVR12_24575 [Chitinophaga silvatica]
MTKHPTEEELQNFALGQLPADPKLEAHMHECLACQMAVENYQAIFSSIKSIEQPVFDFDVEQLVLSQLPKSVTLPSRQFIIKTLLLVITVITVVTGILMLMNEVFGQLLDNISLTLLSIILSSTLGIVTYLSSELLNTYRAKMQSLNFY